MNFTAKIIVITLCLLKVRAELPCPIAYKCSNVEDIVWATDGQSCFVYRNGCHLKNENCQRQNRYEEVLRDVPKEECQKLCKPICTQIYDPVCGYYDEEKKTFSSNCTMQAEICSKGKPWSLFQIGECPQ